MMQTSTLVLIAGTTLFAGTALADNAGLVADAGARTSYAAGGTYAGSGFTIADQSGNNSLTIGGAAQFRYNLSFRDEDVVGSTSDLATGFNAPLTRLRASGNIVTKELSYKIQLTMTDLGEFDASSAGNNGVAVIDDAYAQWDFGNNWNVRWGQFNLPVIREVVIGAEDHLGLDFSETAQFFGQGYSQGVQVGYADERIRAFGAFSDGAGTANTNFISGAEADYALSLRVEGLVLGSGWERFNNYTSWRGSGDDAVLVGGALHFQDGGETAGTSDTQIFLYTVDATWEGPGYNVTGVFYGRNVETTGGDQDDFAFMLQGGYFFTDEVEAFLRWDGFFLDDNVFVNDNVNLIFAGINWYLSQESNAAKFTAQFGYAFDDTNEILSGNGVNSMLGQATDGEVSLGAGFQLVF
jgi:hypothetical protein